MPTTDIIFYQEEDGIVPIVDWLDGLPDKARVKCLARLGRLEELGHEIRRPEADLLRDGIYELRIGLQGINYVDPSGRGIHATSVAVEERHDSDFSPSSTQVKRSKCT